jgi:hypothetical protein
VSPPTRVPAFAIAPFPQFLDGFPQFLGGFPQFLGGFLGALVGPGVHYRQPWPATRMRRAGR